MKKALPFGLLSFAVFISGCATHPDELGAASISPARYAPYDCRQIGVEQARVEDQVNTLYVALAEKADTDNTQAWVGGILLWPTLFWLDGDGPRAAEYRQIKGEYSALQQASTLKNCDIAFRNLEQELADKKEEAKNS